MIELIFLVVLGAGVLWLTVTGLQVVLSLLLAVWERFNG
jgi:hypothetical protein